MKEEKSSYAVGRREGGKKSDKNLSQERRGDALEMMEKE